MPDHTESSRPEASDVSDPSLRRAAEPTGTVDARPFPWDECTTLDADRVERGNRLARLLPVRGDDSPVLQALAVELERLIGLPHRLRLQELRVGADLGDFPVLGDAFRTHFHLPPDPATGVLALEMELVDAWLASLLDAPPETRSLGEVDDREFALVTFVLLQALETLKERGAPPVVLPTDPPLDDFTRERLSDTEDLVELTLEVRIRGGSHLARLFLPDGLIRNMEGFAEASSGSFRAAERLRSGPMGAVEIPLPAVAGGAAIRRSAVRELERGDVVLFDWHGWSGSPGEDDSEPSDPRGRLYLRRFARDRSLPGLLRTQGPNWAFEIASTRPRTHDEAMTEPESDGSETPDGGESTDGESLSDSTELLESPEVRLEVRVGTARLTLRELGELTSGQILELDREIGDRADLVVEGETVGAGELVDVEGRIGIRIDRIDN